MADEECTPTSYEIEGCCTPPLVGGGGGTQIPGPPGPPGPPGISCPLFCGTGSPEGVVTSPIGGIYEQTDAASTSHSVWFKHSGTGNTGWRQWAGMRGGDGANTALRMGDNSIASAVDSIAIGENAEATAQSAIAIGKNTLASGARSEAYGQDSEATADDAKAFGAGAIAAGIKSIALGAAAQADAPQSVAIGNGRARGDNDIIIGFDGDIGQTLAHPNIVIGYNAEIGTTSDSSSPTPSLRGGHVIIGENALAGMGPSQFPNIVIGRDASSVGRAVIAIGQNAQARAADTPVSGQSEGRFATIIGYLAKGSGGCIVSVGDQCDVRGDSTVAVGTHARANFNNTVAVGPNCFAGNDTSTDGNGASAFGVQAQAKGVSSIAIGHSNVAEAIRSIAFGPNTFVDDLHEGAICIGFGALSQAPKSITIGDNGFNGGDYIHAIYFNGNTKPAMFVTLDGTIQFIDETLEPNTSRTFPITSNITLDAVDTNILVDSTAAARTITLPLSAAVPIGKRYLIRRENAGANNVSIVPSGGETIGGLTNFDLTARYKWAILFNDGTLGFEWTLEDWN